MPSALKRKVPVAPVAVPPAKKRPPRSRPALLLKVMRPHQWAKNCLLFVPLVLAHRVLDLTAWLECLVGFAAFSACASAGYVINDLVDVEADRRHPDKCRRPFASGALPASAGRWLVPLLLTGAFFFTSLLLPARFALLLGIYLVGTLLYSSALNRVAIADILVLAGFYSLRLLAGGAAASVPVSPWLLAFSTFFFVSLAFLKRVVELVRLEAEGDHEPSRAGYTPRDLRLFVPSGLGAGYVSVLVLALFISSPDVAFRYHHPQLLWGVCPLLLYWISRVWYSAHRGTVHSDPVVYAFRDPTSLGVGTATLVLLLLAAL